MRRVHGASEQVGQGLERDRECEDAEEPGRRGHVLAVEGRSADEIFGPLDAMKVRSSMTLFHRSAPDEPKFKLVLDRYYGGVADPATDERLRVS